MDFQAILQKVWELLPVYGLRLLAAIVIFVIGKWVAAAISKAVKKIVQKTNWGDTLANFLSNLTYFALLVFVILAALSKLGIQTTSFVAILGAAGLAVGFALQGSLSNFAAGVMLIIFKPFKVGDLILAGGEMGVVEEIQIFVTVLAMPTGGKIVVPNSQVTGGSIKNFSPAGNITCVDLTFLISYGDDILKAKKILQGIIESDQRVLQEPAPYVVVKELSERGVSFAVRPYTTVGEYWGVYFDVHEQVKVKFDEAGITIPYPQTDVHIHQER